MNPLFRQQRPGAMLLITVMIVGAVALVIAMSLALAGIGEMEMSHGSSQAQTVLQLADGCMEEGLIRLWADGTYRGGELRVGKGKCMLAVEMQDGFRVLSVEASEGKWVRRIRALVDTESIRMEVLEWRQIH